MPRDGEITAIGWHGVSTCYMDRYFDLNNDAGRKWKQVQCGRLCIERGNVLIETNIFVTEEDARALAKELGVPAGWGLGGQGQSTLIARPIEVTDV